MTKDKKAQRDSANESHLSTYMDSQGIPKERDGLPFGEDGCVSEARDIIQWFLDLDNGPALPKYEKDHASLMKRAKDYLSKPPMSKEVKSICKNCKHWKSEQMELSYRKDHGFCTSPGLEYNMEDGTYTARLMDRSNTTDRYLRSHFLKSESDGTKNNIPIDRYTLVTGCNFGCIHFER